MDWDKLLNEARSLAREAHILLPLDMPAGPGADRVDAIEGGRIFRGLNFEARHWMSIRSTLLPMGIGTASPDRWISFITGPGATEEVLVIEWDHSPLPFASGSRLLRAEPYQSLPPLEGIFRDGSARVGDWLEDAGWDRNRAYSPDFPDPLAGKYDEYYLSNSPQSHPEARALVGGWHNFWPDGDWYMLCDYAPVVAQCSDGERLLEIYHRPGEWLAVPRIV